MKRVIHCIPVLLALVLVQIGFAADRTGPLLEEIRFDAPGRGEERVTFRLSDTAIPRVFALKGENPRVVFDFPDTTMASSLASTIDTGGRFIRRIRTGLHGEPDPKTRVVLDLVPGVDIDFRQQFDQSRHSLVVTLFRAGTPPSGTAAETSPSTPPAEKKPVLSAEKNAAVHGPARETVPPPAQPAPPDAPPVRQPETAATPAPAPPAAPVRPQEKKATPAPEVKPAPQSTHASASGQVAADRTVPAAARTPEQEAGATKKTKKAAGTGPVLSAITFNRNSNRGEMVLFKLSEFHPPVVFGIEKGLPRVVCDFKGTTADAGVRNRIDADGRYVRTIRVGRHRNPDKVRVVLDLAPNNNYDLQQVFFKDDNLFVIIVNTIDNAPTREEIEKPLPTKSGS